MYDKQVYLLDKELEKIHILNDAKPLFYLAGGCVTSVFSGSRINDLDIFFRDETDLEAVRKLFNDEKVIFETSNAVSYTIKNRNIQLIKAFVGVPKNIIGNFDFTISMGAYDPHNQEFILGSDFLYDLAQRVLRYNPGGYPFASLWRANKFIKRGFILPAIESIKLAMTINNVTLQSFADLKKQIEGIDTSFLKDLTDAIMLKLDTVYDFNQALEFMDRVLRESLYKEDEVI